MKTLGKSEECNGGMGTFQLMSRHNQNMGFLVDCLYNNLSEVYLRSQYVDVPRLWQEKYGLDPVHCTPEGFGVIILGSDMQQFHPWPLARDGGLVLYKSQIDGQFVFGGSLSAENMHKYGDLPDINSVGVRRIAVECSLLSAEDRITSSDRDWEKIAQGEQGSLIPLLCSKCRQRSCSDCSKMFEKSPQVAYEDEILASSLSLERSDENGPGVWKVKCKYNQKLRDVPDLEDATKKFQLRLEEKKLTKNPELSEGFNKKIQEGIDRGDFVGHDCD